MTNNHNDQDSVAGGLTALGFLWRFAAALGILGAAG